MTEIPRRVFLPWYGHFGDLIHDVLPMVWSLWEPGDIIGGNPGHAALYPGPLEPRLWAPVAATYPRGYDYTVSPIEMMNAIDEVAHDLWPYSARHGRGYGQPAYEVYPKPTIVLPEPAEVDVVLAPRLKPYEDYKNGWPWAELAAACKAKGWKVGIAGTQLESEAVPGDVAAWELDPPGDTVTGTLRLLRGARCTVSLDSGIAHLASLVGVPQVVLYANPGDETKALIVRDGLEVRMRFDDIHAWNPTQSWPVFGTVADVVAALEVVLGGGTLPAWTASVS